jgi:hypothetical protein
LKLAQVQRPVNSPPGNAATWEGIQTVQGAELNSRSIQVAKICSIVALAAMALASFSNAQGKKGQSGDDNGVRLRIEVSGGDKPVDAASVYVRYVIKHNLSKDENVEMNIKTNPEGIALSPAVPRGKVIVQVVAEGWKPFGQSIDATEDQQVIKVHLEKPPRWY